MAISRTKTWIAGEVLTAADLNAEFNNVINNALSLVSPLTGALDANGNEIVLDADADSSVTADTDDRIDLRLSGTDLFRFDGTATTPVNGLDFIAAAASGTPSLTAVGTDTNIGINLVPRGTGLVQVAGVDLVQRVLIGTATASSDAAVAFTWAGATYKQVIIQLSNVLPATDAALLYARTSTDGGSSYDSGASDYADYGNNIATAAQISLTFPAGASNVADEAWGGTVSIIDPSDTARTQIVGVGAYKTPVSVPTTITVGGQRLSAADVDGIQFSFSTGDIASGKFVAWGIL